MSGLTSNFEYMNMAGRGHLTTQARIAKGHGDECAGPQSDDVCPVCGHPISDENPITKMPASLAKAKSEDVPPRFRGSERWLVDGCKGCADEDVREVVTHWLGQGSDTLEDVADLIAEHLGYKLVPVTA